MLIIIGDDLEPEKVTSALGWSPNQAWRRGEHKRFTRRDGIVRTFDSIHEWGGWKLFSSDEECELSLDKQFDAWMARLQTKNQELRSLHDLGWQIKLDFFVATSEYLDLPAASLSLLATLGVELNLTISVSHEPESAP